MFKRAFWRMADAIRGSNKPTTVPGFLRPIDTDRIATNCNSSASLLSAEPKISRRLQVCRLTPLNSKSFS